MAIVAPFKPDKRDRFLPLVAAIAETAAKAVDALADAATAGCTAAAEALSMQPNMPRALVPAKLAAMRCGY